ncbi:MAG: DUF58 domain-containing protein [Ilumatobacteraceae bacterium]
MLTRHGWAAVAAAGGAFAAGRLFGLVELYVVGTALGATAAAALAITRLPLPSLAVSRSVDPPLVAVGDPLRLELSIANRGPRRSPALRLWESVGDGGAVMQVDSLRPASAATAAYRVPTDRRGIVEIGPLVAERHDPFAIARRLIDVPGTVDVVVVPRHAAVSMPEPGGGGPLAQHLTARALGRSGTEFHSQREYVPGDDTRRINWKASARVDTLIVTEREAERLRRCTVALAADDAEFAASDDPLAAGRFELAVSVAASVVVGACAAGVATRLLAPGIDIAGRDISLDALRGLATASPREGRLDPRSLTVADDGLGLIVLVCASPEAGRAVLESMRIAPDDTVVIVYAAGDAAGDEPGGDAGDDLRDAVRVDGSWVIGARSLESFADQWRSLVGSPS